MDPLETTTPTITSKIAGYFAIAFTIAAFALTIYFASVAPAFAIALKFDQTLSTRSVRKAYRPLFDFAPEMTGNYLKQCGVSDIEIYFVLQRAQGEPDDWSLKRIRWGRTR